MKLKVRFYFSPSADTDEQDARDIARALTALGYWQPDPRTGIAPFDPDYEFFNAIKRFQNEHGLSPDGVLRPGGKTEGAINDALRENDRSERYYVWRTVRDDHVRPAHAAREGQVFRWGEDLFGGPPGEDFNCRCWAEPLYVGYKPPPIPKKPEVVAGQPQEENLYPDAIKSTMGPVEIIAGGVILRSGAFHIYRAIQVIETKRRRAIENLEHRKIEPRWEVNPPRNQLQKKYEHAEDFGINGNANNKTLEEFKKAIQRHADDPETQIIKGTYHKQKVTHYYNAKTKLNVIRGKSGDFKTGFKLDKRQIDHIEMYGSLGGGK